jgi:hypothetical protein
MNHKLFKSVSITSLLCIIATGLIYDFFGNNCTNIVGKIALKCLPVFISILLTIFYFVIYRVTLYSFSILLTLCFCLIGDVLLLLYTPLFVDLFTNESIYLIVGGTSFFLARIVLFFNFSLYPFKNIKFIQYPLKKLIISHIIFEIPFVVLGILLLIYKASTMNIFMSLYLFLAFGIPWSTSFLRISELNSFNLEESRISSIFAFVGITLFNFSDIILILSMLKIIPSLYILISDNIYWLAMFFLTISIVRCSDENVEKGVVYFPLYTN